MLTSLSTVAIHIMKASVFLLLVRSCIAMDLAVVFKQLRLHNYCLKGSVWTPEQLSSTQKLTSNNPVPNVLFKVPLKLGMKTFKQILPISISHRRDCHEIQDVRQFVTKRKNEHDIWLVWPICFG